MAESMEERSDFIDPACVEHGSATRVDSAVEQFAIDGEPEPEGVMTWFAIAYTVAPLSVMFGDGFSGESKDFECADESFAVVGVDARGGDGIDAREFGVEEIERLGVEGLSQFEVCAGSVEESFEESLEVHGRSACGDEWDAARFAVCDDAVGFFDESCDGEGIDGVDDVDEVMSYACLFFA